MYDYVIVGAGSAGCVLAARLSEDPDVSVLLLEAGPPDVNENIHVPLGYLQLARTEVDWDYHSAPEPHCDGRRITLPRGACSAAPRRSTRWSTSAATASTTTTGASPGWTLGRPAARTSSRPRTTSAAPREWHGAGGPLPVTEERSRNRSRTPSSRPACRPGLARNDDFNGAEQDGVGMYQVTQRGGHARERRGRLPAPGDGAPEPDRDALHARPPRAVRGHARGRRRGQRSSARCRSCAPSAR